MKKIPCLCLLLLLTAFSVAQKQVNKTEQTKTKTQTKKRPSAPPKQKVPLAAKEKPIALNPPLDINQVIEPVTQQESLIFSDPEEMASYPGGEDSLMNYFINNLHYPNDAKDKRIEGRVVVSFEVCADGKLCHYEVKRSLSPSLDSEAVRVIRNMKKWAPAKIKGKAVSSYYTLPILFQVND